MKPILNSSAPLRIMADDSHPPLEVVVEMIPPRIKGRYLGLTSWIMLLWDHGKPTRRIFDRMTLSWFSFDPAISFDQEVSLINHDKRSTRWLI